MNAKHDSTTVCRMVLIVLLACAVWATHAALAPAADPAAAPASQLKLYPHVFFYNAGDGSPDHVAVAGAGVEVVVAIENDVFGRLYSAQADQFDVAQPVILLERAAFADVGRRRRR